MAATVGNGALTPLDDGVTTALLQQHVELLLQIQRLWIALAVLAFMGLLFVLTMFGLAAWSVQTVNKRQEALEGKFTLLIDVLLDKAQRENAAKRIPDGS